MKATKGAVLMSRETQELQCEAGLEFLWQLIIGKTLKFWREGGADGITETRFTTPPETVIFKTLFIRQLRTES